MKNIGHKIFAMVIFFCLFWCITFTAENFICTLQVQVEIVGKNYCYLEYVYNPVHNVKIFFENIGRGFINYFNFLFNHKGMRFTAGQNSHLGQWFMALLIIFIIPFYFKLWKFFATKLSKIKVLTNLWFIGGVSGIFCFIGEFLMGLLLNVVLKLNVWDYSSHTFFGLFPVNLMGQITLYYTPIWIFSSILAFVLFKMLYAYDTESNNVALKSLKDIVLGLFTKGGNITEIDKDFFNIEADYLKND